MKPLHQATCRLAKQLDRLTSSPLGRRQPVSRPQSLHIMGEKNLHWVFYNWKVNEFLTQAHTGHTSSKNACNQCDNRLPTRPVHATRLIV